MGRKTHYFSNQHKNILPENTGTWSGAGGAKNAIHFSVVIQGVNGS